MTDSQMTAVERGAMVWEAYAPRWTDSHGGGPYMFGDADEHRQILTDLVADVLAYVRAVAPVLNPEAAAYAYMSPVFDSLEAHIRATTPPGESCPVMWPGIRFDHGHIVGPLL